MLSLLAQIPSGKLQGKFLGHFGIVYDMSWSKMDTHLLSASSDGTARFDTIFSLPEMRTQNEQRHDKTCPRGFGPGLTQMELYSHRRWMEA